MFRALVAAGLLLTSGCLLELDQTIACGDGYVDRAVGEECDPAVRSSFRDACRTELSINRDGTCSESCEIDLSACFPRCGNGTLDEGEECDPGRQDPGSNSSGQPEDDDQLGAEVSCMGHEPPGTLPYAGGVLGSCQDDCTLDRSACHRCGDGQHQQEEVCDGDFVDPDWIRHLCLSKCVPSGQEPQPERVNCNAGCSSTCDEYVVADPPECCIPMGEPSDPVLPCCGPAAQDGLCPFPLGE
ncbi:MAG: hypothetical protein ACRBN8_17145 [Nannocystales bacterium]